MEPTNEIKLLIEKDLMELQKRVGIIIDKKPIGKGGFAYIYSGTKDKRMIVIKVICTKGIPSASLTKNLNWAKNDCIVTGNLKNKNCIRCLGIFELENSKMILLDYAANKDLAFFTHLFYSGDLFRTVNIKEIKSSTEQDIDSNSDINSSAMLDPKFIDLFNEKYKWFLFMSESLIRFFFFQILNSLIYLRKMNFIHRDLKLDNLLLMKDFQVKLTDFALSTSIPSAGNYELSSAGTTIYMPPECLDPQRKEVEAKLSFRIDYFALGVILHKMLFNEFLVKDKEKKNIELNDLNDKLDFISKHFSNYAQFTKRGNDLTSKEIQRLLSRLLEKDIYKRADLSEILNIKWFQSGNEEVIRYIQDVYENDKIKFMLELQKIDYIEYYKNKNKICDKYDICNDEMNYLIQYDYENEYTEIKFDVNKRIENNKKKKNIYKAFKQKKKRNLNLSRCK